MNRVLTYAALFLALLAIGCGGSSTGSSTTTNVAGVQTYYQVSGVSTVTPPTLAPGQQVTLTAFDTVGGIATNLSLSNFAVSGGDTIGTVSSGGVLTAGTGVSAGSNYTVSASSSAGTIKWSFKGAGSLPFSPPASGVAIESQLLQSGGQQNLLPPIVEDPLNIQVGELVQFQVVGYDALGGRHVLPASNWRWSDTSNQFGSLDPASGLFSVGQAATPSRFLINATYNGQTVAAFYVVNPFQARITGQVVDSGTSKGVRGIGITFFDGNLNVTGYVTSSYDGTFRASSKTTAVMFSIDPNTVPSAYWQSFSYGLNPSYISDPTQPRLLTFDAGSDTCNATFQTLFTRSGSQLGSSLVQGENFMFAVQQPSTVLTPATPAIVTNLGANPPVSDPGVIVINSRATFTSRPLSNGCTG